MTHASNVYRWMVVVPVLFVESVCSQNIKPNEIVEITSSSTVRETIDVYDLRLYIRFTIKHSWHINSHEPNDQFLIPTILTIDSSADYSCKDIVYPTAMRTKLQLSDSGRSLYAGEQMIIAVVTVPKYFHDKSITLKGALQYQACNDENCLFPVKKRFDVSVKIHN